MSETPSKIAAHECDKAFFFKLTKWVMESRDLSMSVYTCVWRYAHLRGKQNANGRPPPPPALSHGRCQIYMNYFDVTSMSFNTGTRYGYIGVCQKSTFTCGKKVAKMGLFCLVFGLLTREVILTYMSSTRRV